MIEQRLMHSPVGAKQAFRELYDIAVERTKTGARHLLQLISVNPHRRMGMRDKFHGPRLRDIAEQVWSVDEVRGLRYRHSKAAWKEFFRDLFIPPRVEEYVVKKTGEVKTRLVKRSTEDLPDDEFSEFLLQVEAFAVVDLGVVFIEEEEEPYKS